MINRTTKLASLAVGIFSIAALLSIPLLAEEEHQHEDMRTLTTPVPTPAKNCVIQQKCDSKRQEMCVEKLNQVIKAIDEATKAVETGYRKTLVRGTHFTRRLRRLQPPVEERGKIWAGFPRRPQRLGDIEAPGSVRRITRPRAV